MNPSKSLEISNRRRIVAHNLLAGATYAEIARVTNVSKATVASDVRAILEEWRSHYTAIADRYAYKQLRRYDHLLNTLWSRALDGDLPAIDRVVSIMDKQNNLLGISKPDTLSTPMPSIQIIEINKAHTPHIPLPE